MNTLTKQHLVKFCLNWSWIQSKTCLFVSRVGWVLGPPFAWRTCLYLQRSPKLWIPSALSRWFRNLDNQLKTLNLGPIYSHCAQESFLLFSPCFFWESLAFTCATVLVLMVDSQSDFCCTTSLLVLSWDHLCSSCSTDVQEYAGKTKFQPYALLSTNYRTTD